MLRGSLSPYRTILSSAFTMYIKLACRHSMALFSHGARNSYILTPLHDSNLTLMYTIVAMATLITVISMLQWF